MKIIAFAQVSLDKAKFYISPGRCVVVSLAIAALLACCSNDRTRSCGERVTEFGADHAMPLFPYWAEWVDWDSLERQVPAAQRQSFMDTVHWYNAMYGHPGNPDLIHAVDFNADDTTDYIYYGPGPGFDTREMITVLKINNSVLSVLGTLRSLDFDHGVLKRLYAETTLDTNATTAIVHTSYDVVNNGGGLSLRKFFQSEMSEATEMPQTFNARYFMKTLCSDSVTLYHRPRIGAGDAGKHHAAKNILVLARHEDTTKASWYFVGVPARGQDSTYHLGWTPREGE